jgi:hypothetical protein
MLPSQPPGPYGRVPSCNLTEYYIYIYIYSVDARVCAFSASFYLLQLPAKPVAQVEHLQPKHKLITQGTSRQVKIMATDRTQVEPNTWVSAQLMAVQFAEKLPRGRARPFLQIMPYYTYIRAEERR